jgi:hypothetical protein
MREIVCKNCGLEIYGSIKTGWWHYTHAGMSHPYCISYDEDGCPEITGEEAEPEDGLVFVGEIDEL